MGDTIFMKFDKIMILLSFILVVLLSIGSVSAYSDDNNLTTDSLSAISTIDESNSNDINVNSYNYLISFNNSTNSSSVK